MYDQDERTGYFLFFLSLSLFSLTGKCVRIREVEEKKGRRWERRQRRRRRRRRRRKSVSTVLFMHERQWFFSAYVYHPRFYIHLDWHRACLDVSNEAMQNAIDQCQRHVYEETAREKRENDDAVRCSSCGTNLIPLRFFPLAFSGDSCVCWCWCVSLDVSPVLLGPSSSNTVRLSRSLSPLR